MITIYAEKPDMGTKIAAALDCIHLDSGQNISFSNLEKWDKAIKSQRTRDGYFKINYNGQAAYVTWGFGHMCGLKQAYDYNPEYKSWSRLPLPFIPESYDLKLTGSEKQYAVVKKLFKSSSCIISATDDDREGDLIFYYLYRYMNCTVPFKRALFNKQSQEEFIKAFDSGHLVDGLQRKSVIDAGRARSAGDFIVGAGLTAAMSLKYPGNGVLSVGRVQTAVLNMIVEREIEIKNFKPKDFWVIGGKFTTASGDSYIALHEKKRFESLKEAETIFNKLQSGSHKGIIKDVSIKKYTKKKPFLYSLASLQMDANRLFGLTLEQTLETAQKLYEKGYTTDPRTDSVHLPDDMVDEMNRVISNLFSTQTYRPLSVNAFLRKDRHYFDSAKVESHYAIVPTTKIPATLSGAEQKVYDLIARSVICMVYPEAVLSQTRIETEADGEIFTVSGSSVIDAGFLKVLGMLRQSLIPNVKKGEEVTAQYVTEKRQTEPPKRYTDATILKAMINCGKNIEDEELKKLMANGPGGKPRGLGRPSSQASIVSTLEGRGYTQKKGKTIIPTSKGMMMIESFPVDDLKSPVMTAQWEKRLDDIETGNDNYSKFMYDLENHVRQWTQQVISAKTVNGMVKQPAEAKYKCPVCGRAMNEFDWGFSCSGYQSKECSFSLSKTICGKKLSPSNIKALFTKGVTGVINGFSSKEDPKKKFSAVLKIDKESARVSLSSETELICPFCGKPLRATDWGYSCTGYHETGCRFMIGSIAKRKLSVTQIKKLLNGESVTVTGMKKNNGEAFSATVFLQMTGSDAGKLKFCPKN